MLQDLDQRVIPAVLRALVAAKSPDAERILMDQLKADDFVVRVAAATGLAALETRSAIPALVDAYRAAAGDSTYVARAAMVTAVNAIDPAAARALLQVALQDNDWAVRVKAAMLFRDQGVTDTAATIRPASVRPIDEDTRQVPARPVRSTRPPARPSWPRSSRRTRLSSWIGGRSNSNWRLPMRRSPSRTSSTWRTRVFSTALPSIVSCRISSF